ncbi:MAG: MFS transporter [Acidobacteriota bacterium]
MAGFFWSLGLMAYFLVYNLYLLDLDWREDRIGQIAAAMTLGSLAFALPSGLVLNRFGLVQPLRLAVLATVATLLLRAWLETPFPLMVLAFLSGAGISAWMVTAPPLIAALTDNEFRPRAFSLTYGISIGTGALAGVLVSLGSRALQSTLSPLATKRLVLTIACTLVLGSFALLGKLRAALQEGAISFPVALSLPSFLPQKLNWSFLARLFPPLALWSLFVGSFPPFFNVFFQRQFSQTLESIGILFSMSQIVQASAVLLMPWVVKSAGKVLGIALMQICSALCLGLLSGASGVWSAASVYLLYLSFQVMCEPALENFIMDSCRTEERNMFSSVRYALLFFVQAVAVWLAGTTIAWFGYGFLFSLLVGVGVLAPLALWLSFGRRKNDRPRA